MTQSKSTLQILMDARKLIAPRSAWIQTDMAHNSKGEALSWTWAGATCFCAVGAVGICSGRVSPYIMYYALTLEPLIELAKDIKDQDHAKGAVELLTRFNDTHTHKEVLALFDTTISRLIKESK